jgi:eukaryotic-like serine/threonine-protein kinase
MYKGWLARREAWTKEQFVSVLEPGIIFGRDFKIVKALRSGGMGTVYVADQLSTGKQRALKVMAPEFAVDPMVRERFILEARAASTIESDHVVEIVTSGIDEETDAPFLVMELLKGEDLADYLDRAGPVTLGDAVEIFLQLGHGLERAHQHGIIHRDLKPENIFLCVSRRNDVPFTVKVLDFGLAKLIAESHQSRGTQPLGTPSYMAPEQTEHSGRICPATDVWALGLIAFRLLTGYSFWLASHHALPMLLREICVDKIPFASVRVRELTSAIQIENPDAAPLPSLPPGFDAWFARCVHRDIDARFPEAGEAVRAFADLYTAGMPRGLMAMIQSGSNPPGPLATPSGAPTSARGGRASGVAPLSSRRGAPPSSSRMGARRVSGATGAPLVSSSSGASVAFAPKKSPARALLVFPLIVAAAALIFYMTPRAQREPAPSTGAAAASASASVAASAAASDKTICPEGSILIKGGKMFMGSSDLNDPEKPPHEVTVSTFCIDRTEVTTKAYLACVDKVECERPMDNVRWRGVSKEQQKRFSPLCNGQKPDHRDHPINCVSWAMASNYCKKRDRRLPTEAEWEFAARGSSQRKYPWGDEAPSAKYLNACGKECKEWGDTHDYERKIMYEEADQFASTAPVGSFPAGASVHGVLDLAGNVWEWTADWYGPYAPDPVKDPKGPQEGTQRTMRGGDFFGAEPNWARPAYRWKDEPDNYNHAIGFRCAADPR